MAADPAPVMLRVARLIPSPSNMTWVRASADHLAIDNASVNVVAALATVHHWGELDASCREIRRVLAPGGRFVAIERRIASITAEGLASHGWTPEQGARFAEVCRNTGFAYVAASVEHEGGNEYVAVIARVD
jgi:ubiquinone/menaquinone biosynthesis C-methylase UbiE